MRYRPHRIRKDLRTGIGLTALLTLVTLSALAREPATFSKHTLRQGSTPVLKATPTPTTEADNSAETKNAAQENVDKKSKKEKRYSLVPIPIPIKSPTFGTGMILGLAVVLKLNEKDLKSRPSTFAFVTAFTNNGTRAVGLGGKAYFAENKYQAKFLVGTGRAVYDYFGIGRIPGQPSVSTEIHQTGRIIFGEFMRNVWKDVFVGARYQYRRLTGHLGDKTTPGGFVIPPIDIVSTTAAMGFRVERDLRDNEFYPTKGSVFSFKADFFAKAFGSNRTYQTYGANYNGYRTIGEKQVLAYRASACSVSEQSPFYDVCFFGASSDLRGYTAGEFQNRRMFATQVEYRRELKWRLGVVGFAGVGGVAPHWNDFKFDELLPAAGVGLRFVVDKKNHINYRVDVGFGRAGHTLTMAVSEAF